MDLSLDLDKSLRPGLDILASEIIIALKKRSRFVQNLEIYRPGLVVGRPETSLLMYELARVEQLHSELGRYSYANQEAFTDFGEVNLVIKRESPPMPVKPYRSKLGQEVIEYYLHWIETCLEAASDSDTYGETVTADVAALLNIFERITLGKYVAEAKFTKNPEPILETHGETDRLRPLLVHAEREAEVLDHAEQLARHYDFAPDQVRGFFEWMIDMTVECQVRYLQKRIRETL